METRLPWARPLQVLFDLALPCPRRLRCLFDMRLPCPRPLLFLFEVVAPCAADIIESAGLDVIERRLPPKPVLAVKKGRVSGTVVLILKAVGKDAFYEFQRSDDGKKSWIDLPTQTQSTKEVPGLVPGTTYWFRARGTTRRVGERWCDPVSYVAQ